MVDSMFFRRQSKRSYLPDPVPREKLDRILEIVRWSPSCSNNQPWKFIVTSNAEQKAKFAAGLSAGNQWAAKAPILVAVCSRPKDDFIREDDPVQYYQFGCGLAVMSLLLAAVEEGLMGHPMAGYNAGKVKAALHIPEEYNVVCVISLGYPGSIDDLDAETRAKDEKPRTRKEVTETFFFDGWTQE